MNKKLIIILVVFLLLVVGLSGCFEETKENKNDISNKFIGTWTGGMHNGSSYYDDELWEFFTNGSLKQVNNYGSVYSSIDWYTYEIYNDGELCLRQSEISFLMCFIIEFEDNDSTCLLSLGEEIPMFRIQKTQKKLFILL